MCVASTCLVALMMTPSVSSAQTYRSQLQPKEIQLSDSGNVQSTIWSDELNTFKSNLEQTKKIVPGVPLAKHFSVVTAEFRDRSAQIVVSVFLNNCHDYSNLSLPESLAACPMRVARIENGQLTILKSEKEFWFSSPINEYQPRPSAASKNYTTLSYDPAKNTLTSDVFVGGQQYEKAAAEAAITVRILAEPFPLTAHASTTTLGKIWADKLPALIAEQKKLREAVPSLSMQTEAFVATIKTMTETYIVSAINGLDCRSFYDAPNERDCLVRLARLAPAGVEVLAEQPDFPIAMVRGRASFDASSNSQNTDKTLVTFNPATRSFEYELIHSGRDVERAPVFTDRRR